MEQPRVALFSPDGFCWFVLHNTAPPRRVMCVKPSTLSSNRCLVRHWEGIIKMALFRSTLQGTRVVCCEALPPIGFPRWVAPFAGRHPLILKLGCSCVSCSTKIRDKSFPEGLRSLVKSASLVLASIRSQRWLRKRPHWCLVEVEFMRVWRLLIMHIWESVLPVQNPWRRDFWPEVSLLLWQKSRRAPATVD